MKPADLKPGMRVTYEPTLYGQRFEGTVDGAPWQLGLEEWVVSLVDMEPAYAARPGGIDGRHTVKAAALSHLHMVDFWNLIAREKYDCPPLWRWFKLEALAGGSLPRAKTISKVVGAVCTARFQSGPRKGRSNWAKRDRSTERELYVPFPEFDAFCLEWEQRSGRCNDCYGSGRKCVGWSIDEGDRYAPCRRCNETGKAPSDTALKAVGG